MHRIDDTHRYAVITVVLHLNASTVTVKLQHADNVYCRIGSVTLAAVLSRACERFMKKARLIHALAKVPVFLSSLSLFLSLFLSLSHLTSL